MFTTIIEYDLEELKKEIGKYILCQSKEKDSTRLFISRFNSFNTAITKEGWWDTFTVSKKPCQIGYYICSIDDAKIDRNGHIMIIASPVKYLGCDAEEDSIAWKYLFNSGMFSSRYTSGKYFSRYNPANVYDLYINDGEYETSGQNIYNYVLSKFLAGVIDLVDLAFLLESPSKLERIADDVNRHIHILYSHRYPLLAQKLPKQYGGYTLDCTLEYIQRKVIEYDSLKLGDETNVLNRVEAVLKYWHDLHFEEKKQKRLEKKNK